MAAEYPKWIAPGKIAQNEAEEKAMLGEEPAPSAADLDAVAAEAKVAEVTEKPKSKKGK